MVGPGLNNGTVDREGICHAHGWPVLDSQNPSWSPEPPHKWSLNTDRSKSWALLSMTPFLPKILVLIFVSRNLILRTLDFMPYSVSYPSASILNCFTCIFVLVLKYMLLWLYIKLPILINFAIKYWRKFAYVKVIYMENVCILL